MQNINVRLATAADAEKIYNVQKEAWMCTYISLANSVTEHDIVEEFHDSKRDARIGRFTEMLKLQEYDFATCEDVQYVTELDGQIVAFTHYKRSSNHLHAIYVVPTAQGKGIGSMLMAQVEADLSAAPEITLSVATYNTKAISFYEHKGFVLIPHSEDSYLLPTGVKIPTIKMVRKKVA